MCAPRLASVLVGRPRRVVGAAPWFTAFFKEPVSGRNMLRAANLEGDAQADTRVHGGPDKAVCVYSADHYPAWSKELGMSGFGPGAFGENFSVTGQVEDGVCIGDQFRVGNAIVEVSQPRGPCWKIGRRWGLPDLPKLVLQNGRTGWYLRVIQEGTVEAGDVIDLLDRPFERWTIARVNDITYATEFSEGVNEAAQLASCEKLARGWRVALSRRILSR